MAQENFDAGGWWETSKMVPAFQSELDAVLSYQLEQGEHPVTFAFCLIVSTEKKYSQIDNEALY